MSLILDALHKADRERQANEAPPGIHTTHDVQVFQNNKPPWLYIAAIALSLTVVAVVAWWLLSSKEEQKPVAVAPAPEVSAGKPETKKSTTIPGLPKPVLVKKEKPATTNKSAVNNLYEKQLENADKPAQARTETAAPSSPDVADTNGAATNSIDTSNDDTSTNDETGKAETRTDTEASDTQDASVASKTETTESQQATTTSTSPPAPAPKTHLEHYPEVGTISDLPWTVINKMPSLNYSSHVYTNNGERKQIVINNQPRGEGQRLSENILIHQILKDGAILEYEGHKFKLIALNSWVNI